MDEVLRALKAQVEKCGLFETAILLGHNNTQTIRRWLKDNRIPDGKVKGTKVILDASKAVKGQGE